MKKHCVTFAVAMMIAFLGVLSAAAQDPGPQGVGSDNATKSSAASHSHNPIHWIKKDADTKTEKPKKTKSKKTSGKSATHNSPQP